MAVGNNPLELLTDHDLFRTQVMVQLLCNRAKTPLLHKNRVYTCQLIQILYLEATRRGKPSPQWPYKA